MSEILITHTDCFHLKSPLTNNNNRYIPINLLASMGVYGKHQWIVLKY